MLNLKPIFVKMQKREISLFSHLDHNGPGPDQKLWVGVVTEVAKCFRPSLIKSCWSKFNYSDLRGDLSQTFLSFYLVYIYSNVAPCSIRFYSFSLLISVEDRVFIFCVVLFCELYPGEGFQMRRLDGFGLFSFSPQLVAEWARCCSNGLQRRDLHMDFPFLVALLVTLLLANSTNNARLLLFVVPVAQHLPPSGAYSITLCAVQCGILEVFYRGVCSTCTHTVLTKDEIVLRF